MTQASPGKFNRLPRAPAGSTALPFDEYGLRDTSPARPASCRGAGWLGLMLDREVAMRTDKRVRNRLAPARLRFPEA